jgi:hypothetical protein
VALPGARTITVDGKTFQWICKAYPYERDDFDKVVTLQASDGGPVVQHRVGALSVTPKEVAEMIRAEVARGSLR